MRDAWREVRGIVAGEFTPKHASALQFSIQDCSSDAEKLLVQDRPRRLCAGASPLCQLQYRVTNDMKWCVHAICSRMSADSASISDQSRAVHGRGSVQVT